MNVGQFAIINTWSCFKAVEITRKTPKSMRFMEGDYELRLDKAKVRAVFDSEEDAQLVVNKLVSAKAEMDQRKKRAFEWYAKRVAALLPED